MNNSRFYRLIGAASPVLAIGDACALTPDAASVPAALSALIWGPILALTLLCSLVLICLLRDAASKEQAETAVKPLPARRPRITRSREQRRPLRTLPRRHAGLMALQPK